MPRKSASNEVRVDRFGLSPGRLLAGKYLVETQLGAGWEGEVYMVKERGTGIERAAKLFFPHRNLRDRTAKFYARKLHKLRECHILTQYHTQERIRFRGLPITVLVSDYVEGELLTQYVARQPGRRLGAFEALHLLHAMASGIECIHRRREYHGDLHADNVMVHRHGLGFTVKLLDMFHWGAPPPDNIQEDVCDMIRIFYDVVGGQKHYSRQPPQVKAVCCGLKRTLIRRRFRNASQLRRYLENLSWD